MLLKWQSFIRVFSQMDGSQYSENLWTGFKKDITFNDTLR
jgi:hypothetical protein